MTFGAEARILKVTHDRQDSAMGDDAVSLGKHRVSPEVKILILGPTNLEKLETFGRT